MIKILESRSTKLEWLGASPANKSKKAALLIPQYNESSNSSFEKRLVYYKQVAKEFEEYLDVIIIDDGSTDDSLVKIKDFQKNHLDNTFFVASIYPNADKVGALFKTTLAIEHELIILSDFDTDIIGLKEVVHSLNLLNEDITLMGSYFRMLPVEGKGAVFVFQQLEYTLARSLYKFHKKDGSVPVMPGAGSCYKRDVLLSIYSDHSGLRSGEDREATLIGLKLGYKTSYHDTVLTLTRPPLSFSALITQRVRWNLGYLETFNKEQKYYYRQIFKLSRIGLRTIGDTAIVLVSILLPFSIFIMAFINMQLLLVIISFIYFGGVIWSLNLLIISPGEAKEFKQNLLFSILLYPVIKLSLDSLAWTGALFSFMKKNYKKRLS